MMRTIEDARWSLLCRCLARAVLGLPAKIEQVDCDLCEDGRTVLAYAYFGDGDHDVHLVSWDLPQPISESDFDPEPARDLMLDESAAGENLLLSLS